MISDVQDTKPAAAAEAGRDWSGPRRTSLEFLGIAAYVLLVGAVLYRHEPWADEAQSWMLARDASLTKLWTSLLHYEGTPGLWQSLLHFPAIMGAPYFTLQLVAFLASAATAWLIIRHTRLPIVLRLLLPFTYYLAYQYAVVARSYVLLPLLVVSLALVWPHKPRRLLPFTLLLCLIAADSLAGFVLAGSIAFSFAVANYRSNIGRKNLFVALACWAAIAALCAWAAWPAQDNSFVRHFNFSLTHFGAFSGATIRYAFTGRWLTTIAAIALTLPFLYRGRTLLLFVTATAALCTAGAVIYENVWHMGALFLAWLLALLIATRRMPLSRAAASGLAIVIALQSWWTFKSMRYDWNHAYSGSQAAAQYLKEHPEIRSSGLYAMSYSCTAIKPYFARPIFANDPAYWEWSLKNHKDDPRALFRPGPPEYVITGYKLPAEQAYWARLTRTGGYRSIKHFEGNLFWRNRILESESFDLYQRSSASDFPSVSSLSMADTVHDGQLLEGFYGIEANAWRWTGRTFSAALAVPPGADASGGRLFLQLYIPDVELQKIGELTLKADVNGAPLDSQTLTAPGTKVYTALVPAERLRSRFAVVTFDLDKSFSPSASDARELGVIVTSLGLKNR